MKAYTIQTGDTFSSISQKFNIKEGGLKLFHNLNSSEKDLMQEPIVGKQILIPDDPQLMNEEVSAEEPFIQEGEDYKFVDEGTDTMNEEPSAEQETKSEEVNDKAEESNKQNTESGSSEHDGKYFVIQKGMCKCNQGFKFPKFKVTSHQKHYWNDADGQADYLAVTEDDVLFDPPAMPFGNCKLKPTSGGYLPCAFAAAGKWIKTYDKVKVMGKSCVTEISELMCATGGKITIFKHGQQSEAGKSNVQKASSQEQQVYNPVMDFEEFKEEVNGEDLFEVE